MLRYVAIIVAGGILGALGFSLGTHLVNVAENSRMIHDGQYGMIFLETVPIGWAIGASVATVLARRSKWGKHLPDAKVVAGMLIVGGVVLGPFLGFAGMVFFVQFLH